MDNETFKFEQWDGPHMHTFDFTQLHTSPPTVSICTKPIWKKSSMAFIGVKQNMLPGEVIRVGNLGIKYKIVSVVSRDEDGFHYRIKRVDGASITSLDIDATKKGDKVKIVNRRTFQQEINLIK